MQLDTGILSADNYTVSVLNFAIKVKILQLSFQLISHAAVHTQKGFKVEHTSRAGKIFCKSQQITESW